MDLGSVQRVLLISPHGDDEVLGAGASIARFVESGASVHVIFLSIDASHHFGYQGETTVADRRKEIEDSAQYLGFDFEIAFEGQNLLEKLDTLPLRTLVDLFESRINEINPDLVLVPSGDDYDQDHQACYRAALAATRPIPARDGKSFPSKVLAYESTKLMWSQTAFKPDLYVDVSDFMEKKLNAMQLYKTQTRVRPHVRSPECIEALATLRGAESGCNYAEAYSVMRWCL